MKDSKFDRILGLFIAKHMCSEYLNSLNKLCIQQSLLNHKRNKMKILATIFYSISAVFIGIGFYKILAYENSETAINKVNAYVGGDAYNYIINANYAIAYFVLALLFAVVASSILVIERTHLNNLEIKYVSGMIRTNKEQPKIELGTPEKIQTY